MKRAMQRFLSLGVAIVLSFTMLTGCGNSNDAKGESSEEPAAASDGVKIGVLVQDVSGEEALGFRAYYEDYVEKQYDVTFTYTEELTDAASEKSRNRKVCFTGVSGGHIFFQQ